MRNKALLRLFVIGITVVMCTLVILSAVFPFPEGTWGFLSIGTSYGTLAQEPEIGEIVSSRDRTSKVYYLGNNQYALDTKIGSVHYQDEYGDWQEIDNQWSAAQAPWDWEMLEDGYHTRVLEDFTAGQILLFESQGESVAFQPMALEWTNDLDQIDQISIPQDVAASVSNEPVELLPGMAGNTSKIRWGNGYGSGRHFEWRNAPGRLNKLLTLDGSPPTPPQYIIDGGNPVLRLDFIFDPSGDLSIYVDGVLWDQKSTEQSFSTIEFKLDDEFPEHDWGDKVLWGFSPARFWDSGEGYGVGLTELRKVGNSLYVSVRVPYDWLQTATYPVYVDPTLDLQVNANLNDVYEYENDGGVTDDDYITHEGDDSSTRLRWGAHRWTGVSVPEGATVDVAYVELYIYSTSFDDVDGFWHFEKVVSPAQFTTTDYNVTDRTRTTASAAWDADTLGVGWEQSPSLVTPLQEVIDLYSPTSLVLIFRGNTVEDKNLWSYSYNYGSSYGAKLHIEYTAASNTILLQVVADLDDVYENEDSGDVTDSATYVFQLAAAGAAARYWGAHRWTGVSGISAGDTIDTCYVQLYCPVDTVDDVDGFWHFEELAAPAQFTAGAGNTDVTERDRTETSVTQDVDSLGAGWIQTPSLVTALQEVVDNYSSTALALIFRPDQVETKSFYSRSHNYDSDLAARIFIKWTPAPAPEITNTPDTWAIGIVQPDDVKYFSADNNQDDDYALITNTGNCAVDIEIQGQDIEGGSYDWVLASSAGSEQYSLYANSEATPTVYDIEVKSSAYNNLCTDLAEDDTYDWSMKFTAPTAFNSNEDGEPKSCTITLVASASS